MSYLTMHHLKVKLWGKEIGHLIWNSETRTVNFIYNSDNEDIPDIAPFIASKSKRNSDIPIYGDERPLYQGLPPFIADSLPDSWGNTLMDIWFKDNKIPHNKITPLHKLAFIGGRGMGALEFEPIANEDFLTPLLPSYYYHSLDLLSLYDLSLSISEGKDSTSFSEKEQKTLKDLITIGTSAGGRQMKIIAAFEYPFWKLLPGYLENRDNNYFTTHQSQGLDYLLIKFNSPHVPLAEIEYAYYLMTIRAGIEMEFCALWKRYGVNYFITRRFDRKDGKKILTQTLAAINPEACSYEDIISTCRTLNLSETEIAQQYRRLVFNVLANNTDDHNKNISFLLEEGGQWHLAPAYDLTFIFNENGTGPNLLHRMSMRGKRSGITKENLLSFAHENGIANAETIIDEVAKSLSQFEDYAYLSRITQPWQGIIQNTITTNLTEFGYNFGKADTSTDSRQTFTDSLGRSIENASISVNSKGLYELSAIIDGHRKRRFIRPNMKEYNQLSGQDIYHLPLESIRALIETLLPS